MSRLDSDLTANLTLALTDERFGPYNHSDSNWTQLINEGLAVKNARVIEVLQPENNDLAGTVAAYSSKLELAMEESTTIIGQFGMGSDGHIAGILPNSAAADDSLSGIVTSYVSDPFTRITLTFNGIRRVKSAFLIAFGPEKQQALTNLATLNLPLSTQPAQIIKEVREAYVYNDQIIGENQ